MNDFLQWLTNNPFIITTILAILLLVVLMFLIAFLQGREVSFYPPKIGAKIKPDVSGETQKKIQTQVLGALRNRSQLVGVEEMTKEATEFSAMGMTLVSLITTRFDFFAGKLRNGCNLRFLILDPDSKAMEVWKQSESTSTPEDTYTVLKSLDALCSLDGTKGKCEVRLSKNYLPFSLVYTKTRKANGVMNVEFLARDISISDRPHFHLMESPNEQWFSFFEEQFEVIWADSRKREIEKVS